MQTPELIVVLDGTPCRIVPIGTDAYHFSADLTGNAARMLAALPDLYAALQIAEVSFDSFHTATMTNAKGRDDNRAIKKAALETVRAALAKAEGRA